MPPSDNYLYHNRRGRNCTKCSKRRRTGTKNFKEHIPEAYAKVYSYYIKVGIFLKESQQLNYRLRFEEHTLQLQVKKPSSDQFRIIKVWSPKAAIDTLIEVEVLNDGDIIEPTEKDTRKITLTLGDIGVDHKKNPRKCLEKY